MKEALKGVLFSVLSTKPTTSKHLIQKVSNYCREHSYYEIGNRSRIIHGDESMHMIFNLTPLEVQEACRALRHDPRYDLDIVSSPKGYYLREVGNNELSFEAKQAIGGMIKAVKAGALTRNYVYKLLNALKDFPLVPGQTDWEEQIYRRVIIDE